ncbi:hypothetical protein ABZ845_25980 [Streptomyces sp. NPDC047022]|uniref:hypothetical protein n=1 Tax=Streptomyces sp. NPDC047022 TaxID=3155737 RepID=UPI0033E1C7FD
MVGTNCLGNSGKLGASSAVICSVEAVYDWASFIMRPPASVRELAHCALAFVTVESDGPPSWSPTFVAFAAWASSTERALTLWFRSVSICGLTSCSVSAAWPSHLPAFSL